MVSFAKQPFGKVMMVFQCLLRKGAAGLPHFLHSDGESPQLTVVLPSASWLISDSCFHNNSLQALNEVERVSNWKSEGYLHT